ncbi:MAG: ABC transporter permease [Rhodocyclaceae bacterium]|nr:ABC transporter permease [Rhodocyclaceae bacterium]
MNSPLIELRGIRKRYGGEGDTNAGEPSVEVLHGIDLDIHAGEFVALMGVSGSGKSTLMHILGCLDRASAGTYRFAGQDIASLSADELAWLRREAFGFVFQGYHLIPSLDALHNVQVPAVYAGVSATERETRAAQLLERLGLDERAGHRPHQLSGGQQQRVSIARALMNGGHVILADEPTGALDTQSGKEVMALLRELADAGHTVILITHDPQVAGQARRVVSISDGRIIRDTAPEAESEQAADTVSAAPASPDAGAFMARMAQGVAHGASWLADAGEAVGSAWRALSANRFRTLLTLLGIVIGVASVIALMAVGQGANESLMEKLAAFGNANRVAIAPGTDSRGLRGVITEADAQLLREVPNVSHAMPTIVGPVLLRAGDVDLSLTALAFTGDAMAIYNWEEMAEGIFLDERHERELATVIVLGSMAREKLFGAGEALGQYVLVNNVPFQVIGVLAPTRDGPETDNTVMIPFSTGSRRVFGNPYPWRIQVRLDDLERMRETVAAIDQTLQKAHGLKDFNILDQSKRVQAQREATRQQSLMMALIAGISLVVGGIGVMNIMLMAVKERTREIGIRMATGARQRDIQRQFLTEAVMVSLVGGVAGVAIGLLIGAALIAWGVAVIFSIRAMLLAFGCAAATGLLFGFMPARQAAKLDPVVALAGE